MTVTLLYNSFLINVKQRNHSWPVKLKTFGCNGNDIQLASENVLAKPRFLLSVLPLSGRKKKVFFLDDWIKRRSELFKQNSKTRFVELNISLSKLFKFDGLSVQLI